MKAAPRPLSLWSIVVCVNMRTYFRKGWERVWLPSLVFPPSSPIPFPLWNQWVWWRKHLDLEDKSEGDRHESSKHERRFGAKEQVKNKYKGGKKLDSLNSQQMCFVWSVLSSICCRDVLRSSFFTSLLSLFFSFRSPSSGWKEFCHLETISWEARMT